MARAFRILRSLGQGAFGEVHLTEVRDEQDFVQTIAVKSLHAQYSNDPEVAGRLRDEARLMALLQHPNIVRVQGLTRIEGRLAVLMEAVHGVDLTDQHLPPRATAELVAAVADALDAAWDTVPPGRSDPLRVVHRDIKPSNIMVTPRGEVKVMDFGVARATFETREAQTRSQQYGTARYMAPERWLEGIAEAPSDVFSLGVTLVEIASGEPFARPRLSKEGFAHDIAAPLASLDAWPALQDLARAMVSFDPNARPKASEVMSRALSLDLPGPDLREWAAGLAPQSGTTDGLTGTIILEETGADTFALSASGGLEPTAPALPLAQTPETPVAPPMPRWVPWSAAGVLGVAALLAWLFLRGPSADSRPLLADPNPIALTPTPEPPAPTPVPRAEPATPEATPTAPATASPEPIIQPEPEPAARPVPVPTEAVVQPDPEPTDVLPVVLMLFDTDPGLSVHTSYGSLSPGRGTLELPQNRIATLTVDRAGDAFHCTIDVGTAPALYRIHADGHCSKEG